MLDLYKNTDFTQVVKQFFSVDSMSFEVHAFFEMTSFKHCLKSLGTLIWLCRYGQQVDFSKNYSKSAYFLHSGVFGHRDHDSDEFFDFKIQKYFSFDV
jgi:hypothetical protein